MKTKDKDIKTKKPLIKTLHTTLACMVATSAFALDDRFSDPKPDSEPDPQPPAKTEPTAPLPDLVPIGINAMFDHLDNGFRIYNAKVTVANFGKADSADFMCLIGYRVLATNDAAKYPVGSSHYSGWVSFSQGLKVMDMVEESHNWAFNIPEAVTHAEIVIIVDRFWNLFDPADLGTWEDDTGKDLVGWIVESDETNNVLGGKEVYYVEYQEPDKTVSVPKNITLKPRN